MPIYGQIILENEPDSGDEAVLRAAALASLLLWHPRLGEAFTVISPGGVLFRARLRSIDKEKAILTVFEIIGGKQVSPEIILLQALPEKERMELIIQKTAELGVAKIIPVKTTKSIGMDERDGKQRKSHRWQEIALKASKQSRRDSIPEVLPFMGFEEALGSIKGAGLKLTLWEKTGIASFKDALAPYKGKGLKSVALLSGPEGGLVDDEVEAARSYGFTPVSLGQRILRAETASIFAVGLTGYELENAGSGLQPEPFDS